MGSFTFDLNQQIKNLNEKQINAIRKIGIETYKKVIAKTPVDTGALRNSWTVSINLPPASFDKSESENEREPLKAKFGDTIIIATNKPYAPLLEYGFYPDPPKNPTGRTVKGFSKQAPQGMVRITIQETRQWLEQNAKYIFK